MKRTTLIVLLAVAAVSNVNAQVFKCATAKGIAYQDHPCADGKESTVAVHQNTLVGMRSQGQRAELKEQMKRAEEERQASTKEGIARKYGAPDHCNVTTRGRSTDEQCIYIDNFRGDKRYVYFHNGHATSEQHTE
jgi:hypothetical protein